MKSSDNKVRLDEYLVQRKLVDSRHQAADLIKNKFVKVNNIFIDKPSFAVDKNLKPRIWLKVQPPYVTRGGYKLAGVCEILNLNFKNKIVLDVGAHRGGFSDFISRQNPQQLVTVDVGHQQLAARLRLKAFVLPFCKIDIRDFAWPTTLALPDIIVVDVSFISLTKILNELIKFCQPDTQVLVLVKPQFEAQKSHLRKGVVKNKGQRREIFKDFEAWLNNEAWLIQAKANSQLSGSKGNLEKFYLLKTTLKH